MKILSLALAGLFLGACAYPNHPHDLRIYEDISSQKGGVSFALFQSVRVSLKDGNQTELIENGRIFDSLVEEIGRAQSSVHIVTFIWRKGLPSDRLVQALLHRKPGVECRVLVDPLGSIGFTDDVQPQLNAAGCEVRSFRPLATALGSLDEPRIKARNHRKMLVRDGISAITGGFGIYKSWLGDGMTPEEWRDTNVRVEGPAVKDLQLAFAANWQESGGNLLPPKAFPSIPAIGTTKAGFVASTGSPMITDAERMTQVVIAAAQHRLWIANSYFIPSTAIGDMLIQKVKQGVDVRVLVPGRVHDWRSVRAGQQSTYERLLAAGVRIWEYQPSMMHSKTFLVDERLVVIGSTNMDPLSLKIMEEGSLVMEDVELAKQMEKSFEKDIGHSLEIRWSWWSKRGFFQRLGTQLPTFIGSYL